MNLQIDLRGPRLRQELLDVANQRRPDFLPAMSRIDGQRIDPTAVPVVPAHHRAHQFALDNGNKEQASLRGELLPNHGCRIVPWLGIAEDLLPERDNLALIRLLENTDF